MASTTRMTASPLGFTARLNGASVQPMCEAANDVGNAVMAVHVAVKALHRHKTRRKRAFHS